MVELTRFSIASLFVAVAAITAEAQVCQQRLAQNVAAQYAQSVNSLSSQLPTIDQLARQRYSQYGGFEQSCMSSRERQQLLVTQAQQRRDAEKTRRQAARERLPRPIQDNEQQAASKYELAHLLWQHGNAPAARQWLADILDKFPSTQIADRARQTLAQL